MGDMDNMNNIKIRRPRIEDKDELLDFFKLVLEDTFIKEGIQDLVEDLEEEIVAKEKYLEDDLMTNGDLVYFLMAEDQGKIVGTIQYGPSSDLIDSCTKGEYKDLYEIASVFVRPDYQGQGIGSLLLKSIYQVMEGKRIKEFCLDSGYSNAQKIWTKKFGEPAFFLPNYWSEGHHHLIWRVDLNSNLNS